MGQRISLNFYNKNLKQLLIRTVKVWDCSSCELLFSLEGHTNFINSTIFFPKSYDIVSCASDRYTIKHEY